MIEEIVALGFHSIELSHGMTIAKLPGIRKAFARGLFTCSGVHNYFPSPVEVMIDAPDAYEYTSHRPFDRQRAMDMTMRTLDLALDMEQAGVSAIVFTDINRDGAMGGINLEATVDLAFALTTPVIASGGVSSIDDIRAVKNEEGSGIAGVICGRALYDGRVDPAAAIAIMNG